MSNIVKTIEIQENDSGAFTLPRKAVDKADTREYKIQVIGEELLIYPAHLKLHEVATPQQHAKLLEEWANSKKSESPSQIVAEALRREHLYE